MDNQITGNGTRTHGNARDTPGVDGNDANVDGTHLYIDIEYNMHHIILSADRTSN